MKEQKGIENPKTEYVGLRIQWSEMGGESFSGGIEVDTEALDKYLEARNELIKHIITYHADSLIGLALPDTIDSIEVYSARGIFDPLVEFDMESYIEPEPVKTKKAAKTKRKAA
jgi:hypothetical protein